MRTRPAIWTLALVVAACASQAKPVEDPASAAGIPGEPPGGPELLLDLRPLGDAVGALGGSPTAALPSQIADALDALAAGIDSIPALHPPGTSRLHALAKQVAGGSSPTSLTRDALALALEELERAEPPPARKIAYQRVVAVLAGAIRRIDPAGKLGEQLEPLRVSFRSATDATRLAVDQPTWFGTSAEPRAIPTFTTARTEAEAALLLFARTGWPRARDSGARALAALADLLDAMKDCDATSDVSLQTTEMRFLAGVLRRSSSVSTTKGALFKQALAAAVDALAVLAGDRPGAATWLEVHRKVVANLDDNASLAFSRAQVQDALRATLDTTVVACSFRP